MSSKNEYTKLFEVELLLMKLKAALGFVLSIGLCKLVVDKLPKAKEEVVVPKALVQKAVLKAHCLKTMTVSKQSCIRLRIPESNKLQIMKLTKLSVAKRFAQSKATTKNKHHKKLLNEKVLCEDCKFGTASWLCLCKLLLGIGLEATLDATSWAVTGCFAIMPMKKLLCSFLGEASISKFTTESKSLESAALVLTPSFGSNLLRLEAVRCLVNIAAGFLPAGILRS